MKVAVAFLLVLCTLISYSNGGGKGAKAKGVDLKKKLHQKIFHHHHHHHYHHQHHHPHHHRHHHHHHHHPHHHHHHDDKNKHHYHHHHHHYHNPFKHHLHRHHHPHKKNFHHHPHKHPLHQHHHPHKQQIQTHHKGVVHHHSNKRSDITHVPVNLPNKLKLHVQIKDSQATKRQSLPVLLANLGQHLMKLGSSLTPKKSQMEVDVTSTGNADKEGNIRNEVPEPKSSTVDSPAIQDSSSATSLTDSQKKNVSLSEVEALLHHALDAASGDEMGSAFSGNGVGEPTDGVTTNVSNVIAKTDEAATADRRNETFPEPEIYGPLESQEYDAPEKRKESNGTLEEIAAQSFQTENTKQNDQAKNDRSDAGQGDTSRVHDDQWKNVESGTNVSTDIVDINTADQHEKIQENGTQTESSNLTQQSLSEEPKSSDMMNSTLEDEESQNDREVSKSGAEESQKSVTGESAAQNSTEEEEEEEEKIEVSGSGEEPFAETKDNTEGQTAADDKISQGASGAGQPSDKPNQDEGENISLQSIDQNEFESRKGRERQPLIKESADSLDESRKPVPGGNIDQQTVVNVEGNQIMANQSEESFQPDSTEGTEPKKGAPTLEDNKHIDQPDSTDSEKPVSVESLDQSSTSKDAKPGENLDTQATQPVFNEPERSKPATNLEKIFQTQNDRPATQLDATNDHSKQSNQQDHPAFNEIDNGSGASSPGQESIEDNNATQDQDSQTEPDEIAEGPKTPAILDELAEPSSPSGGEPQVVNVEGSQLSDLHEDAAQETGPEDAPDEIPVFTLSSPIGDDSFVSDESTLPTPTSAVTTSSVNFIDSGVNMSPGYSDSSSLSEGYNTFPAIGESSQGVDNSLPQTAGLQRDMLDDPVQESLETAVDSKSS